MGRRGCSIKSWQGLCLSCALLKWRRTSTQHTSLPLIPTHQSQRIEWTLVRIICCSASRCLIPFRFRQRPVAGTFCSASLGPGSTTSRAQLSMPWPAIIVGGKHGRLFFSSHSARISDGSGAVMDWPKKCPDINQRRGYLCGASGPSAKPTQFSGGQSIGYRRFWLWGSHLCAGSDATSLTAADSKTSVDLKNPLTSTPSDI